jgi:hypothetical protein
MTRQSLSIWFGAVLATLLLPLQSQTQPNVAPPANQPARLDSNLNAKGKALESKLVQLREQDPGRTPKAAWAKQVGETHPAYKAAKTQMPAGMGLGVAARSPEQGDADSKAAEERALNRAKLALKRQGKSPSPADAHKLLQDRDQLVAAMNAELAKNREALAGHAKSGDETARLQLVDMVLQLQGEKLANRSLVNASPPVTAAEKEDAKRRYYTFLNQQAAVAEGSKP